MINFKSRIVTASRVTGSPPAQRDSGRECASSRDCSAHSDTVTSWKIDQSKDQSQGSVKGDSLCLRYDDQVTSEVPMGVVIVVQ